jgi:hypothetical protein
VPRYERRLRNLEARLTDLSGLVPYTEGWLDYWLQRIDQLITGEQKSLPGCIPLDVIDTIVAANESDGAP